jgi:uncharacterized protein YbcC (UPF0753/DUF2309 family)
VQLETHPDLTHPSAGGHASSRAGLQHAIEHAAHLLPAQGPITVFVHHNTLHSFEELTFEEGVKQGHSVYGCQPYLPEERYRQELDRGRIRMEDISAVLMQDMGDHAEGLIGYLGTRFHLRLAMLQYPLRLAPSAELRWLIAETDALRRFRDDASSMLRARVVGETRHWVMRDLCSGGNGATREPAPGDRRVHEAVAGLFDHFGKSTIEQWGDATWESFCLHLLWRVCHQGVHGVSGHAARHPAPLRHRDVLLEATGEDSDSLVNDFLVRFCATFLDQGFAHWTLPQRDQGFYQSFSALYGQRGGPPDLWLRGLRRELQRLESFGVEPLESIEESLELLGVDEEDRESFITSTLLALRGWAGMIWQMETNAEWTVHPAPRGSLVEFLAVRLILDRLALAHVAKEGLGFTGPLCDLRRAARATLSKHETASVDQRAFLVFQLAQVLGWTPQDLYRLSKAEWSGLVKEVEEFSALERRRIYHLAYERRYRTLTLDALTIHSRRQYANSHQPEAQARDASAAPHQPEAQARESSADTHAADTSPSTNKSPPSFQIVCCIDDREESFRRHLEEVDPTCETFGVAGFFAVAMYYRGVADAHFLPLCPVVIKPQHYVVEDVGFTFEQSHRRRAGTRRALGTASHHFHVGSRTFVGGIVTALMGSLASIPMVTRILFPRLTAQIRKNFGRLVQPPPVTQLQLERAEATAGPENGHIGYSLDEMINIVERTLRDIGLTSNFARLIIITGHGSSSVNNPHESAYNCGACSGARGGPNARAYAQMANDPRVRARLAQKGLVIPREAMFIGGYHNTCDDSVTYFDLDRLPASHRPDFVRASEIIDRARARNAHERCRRFESAPLNLSADAALRHVEGRAEDLSQVRPEYNHATNALCIVGRRSRTRGLFLDRRCFLASYDPTQDDDQFTILARILAPVVPVCGGISLEYYFSTVDTEGYGCGSKLPHNIASLLGVMTGAASDLRPGLSQQMVEIHEPLRLLLIVETTPDAMHQIMNRNAEIKRLCGNGWVQLATLDPESSKIHVLRNGQFEVYKPESSGLPQVGSSVDWYRGWRDHLGFAAIRSENGN